jgi:hypothetical protein
MGQFIMFCLIISKLIGMKDQNNKVVAKSLSLTFDMYESSNINYEFSSLYNLFQL